MLATANAQATQLDGHRTRVARPLVQLQATRPQHGNRVAVATHKIAWLLNQELSSLGVSRIGRSSRSMCTRPAETEQLSFRSWRNEKGQPLAYQTPKLLLHLKTTQSRLQSGDYEVRARGFELAAIAFEQLQVNLGSADADYFATYPVRYRSSPSRWTSTRFNRGASATLSTPDPPMPGTASRPPMRMGA